MVLFRLDILKGCHFQKINKMEIFIHGIHNLSFLQKLNL